MPPLVTEKVDEGVLARKTLQHLIRLSRPLHVSFLSVIFPARQIKDLKVLFTERKRCIARADARCGVLTWLDRLCSALQPTLVGPDVALTRYAADKTASLSLCALLAPLVGPSRPWLPPLRSGSVSLRSARAFDHPLTEQSLPPSKPSATREARRRL